MPADQPEPTRPADGSLDVPSGADPAVGAPADGPPADGDEAAEAPATLTAYPDVNHPVVLDRETLRRAPRFGRFALVAVLGGLLLGVVLGHIIFPASHPGWSRTIFAFEVMLVTLALTLLAALASDRRSRRPRRDDRR